MRTQHQKALRRARASALKRGLCLKPFRLVTGTMNSSLGPEWFAEDRRNNGKWALVFIPWGDVEHVTIKE